MATTRVTKVIDGDSFEIKDDEIRLEGVEAPELGTPNGSKCKARLESLISDEEIEYTEEARDTYGRLVSQVSLDDSNINDAMNRFIDSL